MTNPVNGDDLIAEIQPTLREVSTQICLRPDLLDEHKELDEKLRGSQLKAGASNRLNPPKGEDREEGETPEDLARQVQELEERIVAASAWFRFRALPKDKYRTLCDQHPPREDNRLDFMVGYDQDAVADALVRKCLFDPVFTEKGWESFVETCAPSEWTELRSAADAANGGETAPPKSATAELILSRLASD